MTFEISSLRGALEWEAGGGKQGSVSQRAVLGGREIVKWRETLDSGLWPRMLRKGDAP